MINQPDEEILAASPVFQNKILALRQQIGDKEQEIVRLNKEIASLQYSNEQLILQKKELDTFVADGIEKKDRIKAELEDAHFN